MNDTQTLEQARQNITLLGLSFEQLDDLAGKVNDARWKYEMLKRKPELGQGPRGQSVTADDLFQNVVSLQEQYALAAEFILELTDEQTVEQARTLYLTLLTSYQRHAHLQELRAMILAGAPVEAEDIAKAIGNVQAATLDQAIDLASATVVGHVAALPFPPIARNLIATTSLRLS